MWEQRCSRVAVAARSHIQCMLLQSSSGRCRSSEGRESYHSSAARPCSSCCKAISCCQDITHAAVHHCHALLTLQQQMISSCFLLSYGLICCILFS